ncbi:caspase family protein [Rhizobium leguminosarum bv. viciae]|uniref:caspase family protein n=1 Tax=Rhizobium ruizarguesonis TaxID=2081791 RepID=UPI00143F2253|nr:caspase family protein [Rhizobium ruizarguesonis]NKJ71810.1 caspase family protein [Rhizobium leguminosarum bv. viciae]NKQ77765.1 peptidase C14 [Rhizobium ruizarguesonis]
MRKALVVGIDNYSHFSDLYGCVNDAYAVKAMLDRHSDGSVNFGVRLITGLGNIVTRRELRDAVRELFEGDDEVALLYFAGHGYIESTGGYLCAGDTQTGDDGLSVFDIMVYANGSKARNKVIILDSCHGGGIAQEVGKPSLSELSDGMTILTASTAEQYATEENGSGVFTSLLVDALGGAASNLIGDVTPGSVYAHVDQSLGPWAQRPVFKTNVKTFVSLRKVKPPLELADLRRIGEFFPAPGAEFQLSPDYEPESGNPDPDKTAVFAILQKYNRVNLLVPVGAPHMYHAAMESRSARLTALGEHYRALVGKGLI